MWTKVEKGRGIIFLPIYADVLPLWQCQITLSEPICPCLRLTTSSGGAMGIKTMDMAIALFPEHIILAVSVFL